ncbi:phytoene desaturase family protein [Luteipulveratus flavus]|uniref:Pyridine nucleotide-disulfide oxidoreductase domain-containing protein 2 n=1 Tax=Luteipulveratus flavus TaxID=3031728 RepID=A0ABT6C8K0_9MICO|nr:NAD(P)/FAD-dependent oxidoreductase [Luteipulveratus sp. YIM 133296]MDF8264853.1 NAD(P)/FAD-dependent oxidoreductase [Luteipulveratus sp. YIM 133296]
MVNRSQESVPDAVVVGAGPNGLVAANALADAGWTVVLLERNDEPGGAVRSAEVAAPGFVSDLFSAFYPLAAASPVIRDLQLQDHGLHWMHAPAVVGHATPDGGAAVLERSPEDTAAGLEAQAAGDGEAWLAMYRHWRAVRDPLLQALFTPFPPVRAALRLARRQRTAGLVELARLAAVPVRRLGHERFTGPGGRLLLTGNAMHSDVPPDGAGSGFFGWLLAMLGQDVGFPVPRGGAGELSGAMARRAASVGVEIRTGTAVQEVLVEGGRAVGVRLTDGTTVRARRGVLADVPAPLLYEQMLPADAVPAKVRADLDRFEWDSGTLKVNWALDGPVPWAAPGLDRAGTVHLGVDEDGLLEVAKDLALRRAPARPFLLLGQMTTADPTRSPAGTESTWAYTHLPVGSDWSEEAIAEQVGRMRHAVEEVAPGFGARIVGEYVQSPDQLQDWNPSLVGGSINAGTSAIHQQLFLRPAPGLGRAETPVEGLYLAGASAHPGGGVHGTCGWNAARAALTAHGPLGVVKRALVRTAWERLLHEPGGRTGPVPLSARPTADHLATSRAGIDD